MWNGSETGAFYRNIVPIVSNKIKYCNKNRSIEKSVTRLRLSKCRLNQWLHQINRHSDGLCQTCRTPETVEHFLLACRESNLHVTLRALCRQLNLNYDFNTILRNTQILEHICPLIKRQL